MRSRAVRQAQGGDPRRRPEPHRPGHRVRLLLLPCRLCPEGDGAGGDHGQLQPGNGVHRLRHLRPALFRAPDRRGRDRADPGRTVQRRFPRRHRAVRRPNAAEALSRAGNRGHPHPRHLAGRHRPGRGPGALPGAAQGPGPQAAEKRPRPFPGRGGEGRRRHRLSPGHPAVLRPRRPGHGNRPRLKRPKALHDRGGAGFREQSRPAGFVFARRHRGRRRRHRRRQGRLRRRHHAAHRGSRHPFRRFRLFVAALFPRGGGDRRDGAPDDDPGRRPERGRADERAVRDQGRGYLYPRG